MNRPSQTLLKHLREHGAPNPQPELVTLLMAEIDRLEAEYADLASAVLADEEKAEERERLAFEAARDDDLELGSIIRREYDTFDDYKAAQKKDQP